MSCVGWLESGKLVNEFKKVPIRGKKVHNLKKPALINFKNKEVFINGVDGLTFHYSIEQDEWRQGPTAN